MRKKM